MRLIGFPQGILSFFPSAGRYILADFTCLWKLTERTLNQYVDMYLPEEGQVERVFQEVNDRCARKRYRFFRFPYIRLMLGGRFVLLLPMATSSKFRLSTVSGQ